MDDNEMTPEEFERLAGPCIPNRFDLPQTPEGAREAMVEAMRRLRRLLAEEAA